jgi:hypothetical protein
MAASINTEVPVSPVIPIRIGRDVHVMAEDEKNIEPVKALTPDILRKWAASGKSLPSVKPGSPPDERTFESQRGKITE